jgi:hypothetical protein
MKFAPLPALAVVTVIQMLLASSLAYASWTASAAHQRTADLYLHQLQLRENSKNGETVPLSFVRLASKEASNADKSFSISNLLSFSILLLAGLQLWLVADASRQSRRAKSSEGP